jgi:hypothetical protein
MSTQIQSQSFSHMQNYLQQHLRSAIQGNPAAGANALGRLQQIQALDQLIGTGGAPPQLPAAHSQVPMCGCMPPPQVSHSAAPAGRGLATGEPGWPSGTVTTAGGYRIVPEGKQAAWSIYAPGQQPGEKAHTRIWGDPHVSEKDGTRWDFTKNSDFVLPDGTRIAANTTSQTGQSVTKSLDITNGADRVHISGIHNNRPQVGQITQDGYQFRAARVAQGNDSFHLGGNNENVHWSRERDGRIDGVITGAHYDRARNGYEQKVDPTLTAGVSPEMRPNPFTNPRAWGNMMRGQAVDQYAKLAGPAGGQGFAWATHMNHMQGAHQQNVRELFQMQFQQLQMLVGLMQNESQWQSQMFRAQASFL